MLIEFHTNFQSPKPNYNYSLGQEEQSDTIVDPRRFPTLANQIDLYTENPGFLIHSIRLAEVMLENELWAELFKADRVAKMCFSTIQNTTCNSDCPYVHHLPVLIALSQEKQLAKKEMLAETIPPALKEETEENPVAAPLLLEQQDLSPAQPIPTPERATIPQLTIANPVEIGGLSANEDSIDTSRTETAREA